MPWATSFSLPLTLDVSINRMFLSAFMPCEITAGMTSGIMFPTPKPTNGIFSPLDKVDIGMPANRDDSPILSAVAPSAEFLLFPAASLEIPPNRPSVVECRGEMVANISRQERTTEDLMALSIPS
ncbi:hypothetical protein IV203_025287 [Nitzschia inconspicua]|uniref:Uncharacterized protein n=1 Tax=Nitzschia inconspicua TaxID=303405 RepID=A0A9K3LIS9_9STRA|nr:hypothetical protein IV203_025287 [Nitzschia inconspicua]